jgi:UDP-glucuronate 4-epimerase
MILVTGCAGFIGSHLCELLLKQNLFVVGIDNINDYYSQSLKDTNLDVLRGYPNFMFFQDDILNTNVFEKYNFDTVYHMASLAGVRYSIEYPKLYVKNNIEGFIHLLENCVKYKIKTIVYASSSSVYGLNKKLPFSEDDDINTCNSPYAASKKCMEVFANTYNRLYHINTIGLRFFTVYGPRGRPDMAIYKFLSKISKGDSIDKYGDGTSMRDYTYVDDIVNGIYLSSKMVGDRIYNLGNSSPITLNELIKKCEEVVGKKAIVNKLLNQKGDVPNTYADISRGKEELGWGPKVGIDEGLKRTYEFMNN